MQRATVLVDRQELTKFRRRARTAYPRETFAFMVGERVGGQFRVSYFDYPKAMRTTLGVDVNSAEIVAVEQRAKREGLSLLGGIHTHPDSREASPSEHDYRDAAKYNEVVQGICAVWKENGRLFTKVRFYCGFPLAEVEFEERRYSRRHRRWLEVNP